MARRIRKVLAWIGIAFWQLRTSKLSSYANTGREQT